MEDQMLAPGDKVVRSVRYTEALYAWLRARSQRFSRSIQRENTYLLERLRNRPDIVKLLDEEDSEAE